MSTIRGTLDALYAEHDGDVDYEVMVAALEAREDEIADVIRFNAVSTFGLLPGLVSKVLVEAGLGTPPTAEELSMIDANFMSDYLRLVRMIRGEE